MTQPNKNVDVKIARSTRSLYDPFLYHQPDIPSTTAKIKLQLYADVEAPDNVVKNKINKFKKQFDNYLDDFDLKASYDLWKRCCTCSGGIIEYNLTVDVPDIRIANRDQIPVQACNYWRDILTPDFDVYTAWTLYTGVSSERDIILGSINQALNQRKRSSVKTIEPLVQDDEKIWEPMGQYMSLYFPCGRMDHLIENRMLNFYGQKITLQFAEKYDTYLAGHRIIADYRLIDMYKKKRHFNDRVDERLKPGQKYGFQVTLQNPGISEEFQSKIIEWGVFCWCRILVKYCRENDIFDMLP